MSLTNPNEGPGFIFVVNTEKDFNTALKLSKAIIYFVTGWSGPERVSRQIIDKAIYEIPLLTITIIKIDVTEQDLSFVENWLLEQRKEVHDFNTGGMGETVLVRYGKIIDYIKYPAQLGLEKTIEKIKSWQE